jgi:uncharacterized protein YoxC
MGDLGTTNWLLAVVAFGSAVQTIVLIAALIIGYRFYRQLSTTVAEMEVRHIEPLRRKVDGILADVETITARVNHETERVDQAIKGTIGRVDETAERVRYSVREKVSRATGVIRGLRAILTSILTTPPAAEPPAAADGRAF